MRFLRRAAAYANGRPFTSRRARNHFSLERGRTLNVIHEKDLRIPIKLWTDGVPVEPDALTQLRNVARMPFVDALAVMPDVHIGKGATIGSVIGTHKAIIPSAV